MAESEILVYFITCDTQDPFCNKLPYNPEYMRLFPLLFSTFCLICMICMLTFTSFL